MFIGIYYHSLEAKGRLAIPAKFRQNLEKGSVITRGLDGCLFVFPSAEWERLMRKLRQSPLARKEARGFVRLLTHEAAEVEFDSQGRTRIPQYLTSYASLEKEVVIAGTLNRVEIWDKKRYQKYMRETEGASDVLTEQLAELGI